MEVGRVGRGDGRAHRVFRKKRRGRPQPAFDARTGKFVWSFHTVPQKGEYGNDTWGDDSWSTICLPKPSSVSTPIPGKGFGISDGASWYLGFDLPAPPNLVTIQVNGKTIDAVAAVGKTGYIYVFDRVTGGGFGNPVTYIADGRQHVAIATSQSDGSDAKILSFALPR